MLDVDVARPRLIVSCDRRARARSAASLGGRRGQALRVRRRRTDRDRALARRRRRCGRRRMLERSPPASDFTRVRLGPHETLVAGTDRGTSCTGSGRRSRASPTSRGCERARSPSLGWVLGGSSWVAGDEDGGCPPGSGRACTRRTPSRRWRAPTLPDARGAVTALALARATRLRDGGAPDGIAGPLRDDRAVAPLARTARQRDTARGVVSPEGRRPPRARRGRPAPPVRPAEPPPRGHAEGALRKVWYEGYRSPSTSGSRRAARTTSRRSSA